MFGEIDRAEEIGQIVAPIFAIDPDGSDLKQLLDCPVGRPRFNRDGTRLVFGMVIKGSWQLATSDPDGSDLRVLTSLPSAGEVDQFGDRDKNGAPDWSPDGSWIAFCYGAKLWRVDADGSDPRLLGDKTAFDCEPRFSPDGSKLVFLRGDFDKGVSEPWIRDLTTGKEWSVMPANTRELEHPDWSPDGRWIIYNQLNDPNGEHAEQIERVRADDPMATPEVLVSATEHFSYKPAYSPDGASIVFGCNDDLCTAKADGSDVTTLVAGSLAGGSLNHFAWGPD